jgi:phosphomannomutase
VFGTSGIRGIYGRDITEALAERVAAIFAEGQGTLAIGRDIRESGPRLLEAACRGACSSGADVIDLGILPTPTTALASKKHPSRAIMLTASHNPPEYNGLKLIEDGKEIGKGMEKKVESAYKGWKGSTEAEGGAGAAGGIAGHAVLHDNAIIDDHKALVAGMVDAGLIARKKPKVVVDCNGAASVITPYLLSDLGCRVISVNASLECFNRASEPSRENMQYLGGFIRDCKADFAIAHDGDGDRCTILDETGEALQPDAQLAMMIGHELALSKGSRRIISTVEASLTIRGVITGGGGEMDVTPVGSTYVGDALEARGACFGGEPCGEYIYGSGVHVPDAVLAAAKFAEIFCARGPFSRLKARYPQHFMARERFPARDKQAAMARIIKAVAGLGIEGEVRADDGVRVDEEDGWFLIRASGTEPIVRLTMEYKTRARLEARKAEMTKLIKDGTG